MPWVHPNSGLKLFQMSTLCNLVHVLTVLSHSCILRFPPDQYLGGSVFCPVSQNKLNTYQANYYYAKEERTTTKNFPLFPNFMKIIWIVTFRAI